MTSSGSDLRPSGSCPCKTSNKADNAFVHKAESIVLLSRIKANTLLKPIPTICNQKNLLVMCTTQSVTTKYYIYH